MKENNFIQVGDPNYFRLSLSYLCSKMNYPLEIYNNDPILNLMKDNKDIIKKVTEYNKKGNLTKFLYSNRNTFGELFLEEDESIPIQYEPINKNLEFYFYLTLLIRENYDFFIYNFDPEYIYQLNEENINNKKNKLNQLIKSKLIIELTNKLQIDLDIFEGEEAEKLDNIIKTNEQIIENNISILTNIDEELNFENIFDYRIDELYIRIIIGLIKTKKFENLNYIINIMNELNLEKINLNKYMYDELEKFLNEDKDSFIKNNYQINDENDLNEDIKVNFSYILVKYIFKNHYIYNINFIKSLKDTLKNIFQKNKNAINKISRNKYIKIKEFLDSLFLIQEKHVKCNLKNYYDKYLSSNNIDIKEIYGNQYNQEETEEKEEFKIKENGQIKIAECIYQIFDVKEYRDEYYEIINKSKDTDDKKNDKKNDKKDNKLDLLIQQLAIVDKDIEKDLKDILEKKLNKKFIKDKIKIGDLKLNEDIINELFYFKVIDDDEMLSDVENELALIDENYKSLSVSENIKKWININN